MKIVIYNEFLILSELKLMIMLVTAHRGGVRNNVEFRRPLTCFRNIMTVPRNRDD